MSVPRGFRVMGRAPGTRQGKIKLSGRLSGKPGS
jgi:hypothetical protein